MSIHLKHRAHERPKYRYHQVQLGETMNCIGLQEPTLAWITAHKREQTAQPADYSVVWSMTFPGDSVDPNAWLLSASSGHQVWSQSALQFG